MSLLAKTPADRKFRTDFYARYESEFSQRQMELNFYLAHANTPSAAVKPGKRFSWAEFEIELNKLPKMGKCEEAWVVEDMAAAHATLFRDSLHLLTVSGNSSEKRDVLAWIFAPDTQLKLINGKLQQVHVSDIPFSFYLCAREYGISDMEKFRTELLSHLDETLVDKLHKYMNIIH